MKVLLQGWKPKIYQHAYHPFCFVCFPDILLSANSAENATILHEWGSWTSGVIYRLTLYKTTGRKLARDTKNPNPSPSMWSTFRPATVSVNQHNKAKHIWPFHLVIPPIKCRPLQIKSGWVLMALIKSLCSMEVTLPFPDLAVTWIKTCSNQTILYISSHTSH